MCFTTPHHDINDNVYAPELPPILPEVLPYVMAGCVAMNVLYSLLVSADLPLRLGLPAPAAALCNGQQEDDCSRPDLLAFSAISGLTFIVCGGIGIYSWHVTGRAKRTSPELRLYGYLSEAKWLTAINLTYQIWDFYISMRIPGFCTPIMMTHHAVAGIVAYSGLSSQILSTYAIFYMGLSEVSSIFLVVADLGNSFPPVPGTAYDTLFNGISAPLFVMSFLYYRVVLWWWPMTYNLFRDAQTVLQNGVAEKRGRKWMLYLILALNLPMGFLQLYWAAMIIKKVQSMVL
jgi:hypothetical protein